MKQGRDLLAPLAGLLVAWIAFDVIVWAYGDSPSELLGQLLLGTWGTQYGIGQVLFKATPLLVSGLAFHAAFRAGLFNIGAEGQITVASFAVALFGSRLAPAVSPLLAIPLALVVAMIAGSAWALLPGLLRARYGAHEVISTIMMNRIADAGVGLAFAYGLGVPGTVRTLPVREAARLSRLETLFPSFHGSAASFALVVAVLAVVAVAALEMRTRLGREIGLVGLGPTACAAERIPVARRIVQAMCISGAVAGLCAASTVLGYKGYYERGVGAGVGFGGLAVALLGRGRPVGLVLAALLFGTLAQGGLVLNARVPMETMDVLQAVIIVAVAFGDARFRAALARAARVIVPKTPRDDAGEAEEAAT